MMIDKHEILIDSKACGERVDNAISLKLNNYSRSLIKKMILINNVEINGQKTEPDKRVKEGDIVSIIIKPELKSDQIEPQELDLDFIEINKEFLVLNKRAKSDQKSYRWRSVLNCLVGWFFFILYFFLFLSS